MEREPCKKKMKKKAGHSKAHVQKKAGGKEKKTREGEKKKKTQTLQIQIAKQR